MTTSATSPVIDGSADVAGLLEPLRRFVLSLVRDPHDADDVVQDTVSRVLTVQDQMDEGALTGYAFAVARNLVHDLHRQAARDRRHLPRLVDGREPEQPEAVVVGLEERRALRAALERLPPAQRDLMLAHDLHGQPLASGDDGRGAAALAAQLSRARARARLDYVLALRRVELPTPRCRPVLSALSLGDQRRQRALRAGRHLVHCDTCGDLAPVLVRRQRALAGLLPWFVGGTLLGWLVAALRRRPVQIGSATAALGAVALVAAMSAAGPNTPEQSPAGPARQTQENPAPDDPLPAEESAGRLTVGDRSVLMREQKLGGLTGRTARAEDVRVLSVPADEGFWVGTAEDRVWVQLRGEGESGPRVRVGDRVSFRGPVVAHGPAFARGAGVTAREGAADLTGQGQHIDVAQGGLSVSR